VCYVFRLRLLPRTRPHNLGSIIGCFCHELSSSITYNSGVSLLATLVFAHIVLFAQIPPPQILIPPPSSKPSATQLNQHIHVPRPNAPPPGEWIVRAVTQTTDGPWRHLRGHAELESAVMLFRADEIDYNNDTGDVLARGNVYFEQFERNEKIWADHLEYNTDTEKGKFYDVRGTTAPRIDTRPGMLTSTNPYYFQGDWAERINDHYILYNGFLTNCKMPHPWWRLKGPKFNVVPGESARAYHSEFLLRKLPLFYTPFFYKSLEKVPRRSGFLMPNIGNSSLRGKMLGEGFFWAINRSYDATYKITDFTQRGFAHHVELRGKPTEHSDFDAIFFGVQDRGLPQPTGPPIKQGGFTAYMAGKADLGDGFYARGIFNYLSSFTFREAFSDSFNEAVFSEVNSVGFIGKDWSTYTFDTVMERHQDFQSAEIVTTNPTTGQTTTQTNAVIIRKLPELDLTSRDHQIWDSLPIWYSFDSSGGMLSRSQPYFQNNVLIDRYSTDFFSSRMDVAPRINTAFHWKDFHIVPSFTLDETFYGESQTLYQDRYRVVSSDLLRSAREFRLDFIPPSFERIFNRKTFLGDKLKHVIEPRVTYEYVSGIGRDFNNVIRYDELDLLSNTNEAVFSLTNRLYAKRGNDVTEIFTWELSQARYFDPTFGGAIVPGQRNVVLSQIELTPFTFLNGPRNYSPIVSTFRATPKTGISFQWEADYDPLQHGLVDSSASVDWRNGPYFVSIGHNEVNRDPSLTCGLILITNPTSCSPNANQLRTSFGLGNQTRRGWNTAFVGIYDYDRSILQYAIIQVTYNTDCCGFSMQFRRFNFGTRNENQYVFAFAVANLGSFGNLKRQERLF
jgi:LPS-assembly protein